MEGPHSDTFSRTRFSVFLRILFGVSSSSSVKVRSGVVAAANFLLLPCLVLSGCMLRARWSLQARHAESRQSRLRCGQEAKARRDEQAEAHVALRLEQTDLPHVCKLPRPPELAVLLERGSVVTLDGGVLVCALEKPLES